ncbi:phosphoribosylglycinamide formyltransferase [Candidatus Pelagibacter sp.]|uniref:phosphoribosylglycinamide formyltransferase n=1 Tax=Candidatus Pelagibacter sp. TaxID=2024849 RepID=UPI003F876769
MVLSTGYNKTRTAVFISGTGSNLKSLIKFSKTSISPISINFVISNNSKAKGLNYAKIYKIKKKVFSFKNKKKSEIKLLSILKKNNINMICLAGFMKILSKNFIKKFKGKILNIHPSLLPKYKGLNTHLRVLNNKEKYSGCTVHFVNARLDSGKVILQKKVKISKNETEASLAKKILAQEHKLYPKAILKVFNL